MALAPNTRSSARGGAVPGHRALGPGNALVIIPAATAKHLARSLDGMLVIAVTVAVVATVAGEVPASVIHGAAGPVIITIAAGMFLASLLFRRRR